MKSYRLISFDHCESSLDSLEAHQALLVQLHLAGFGLGYLALGSRHHEILVVKHSPMPTGNYYKYTCIFIYIYTYIYIYVINL